MRSITKNLGRKATYVAGIMAFAFACSSTAAPPSTGDGKLQIDSRIIGGNEASRGMYPFMASLQLDRRHRCGGSLYRRDLVITAAHCVRGMTDQIAERYVVTVGQTLLSDEIGAQRRGIRAVAISTAPDSDLALVFLDRSIDGVVPVTLPTLGSDALYRPGQFVTAMGWGNTDPDLPFFPDRLRMVDVPLLAPEECVAANPDAGDLSTYFCAGVRGQGVCHGDSGSPIIRSIGGRVYQIGVVSFGDVPCAMQGAPAAYVNLSSGELWNSLRFIWERPMGRQGAGPAKR